MRVGFLGSCATGLAIAVLVGAAPTARAQQQDPPKTTSTRRIPIHKDRPATPAPAAAAPTASRVNQDSIAAAERARQDSIAAANAAAAERVRQADRQRQDQARRDSIAVAQRQDSIAAADAAREDSIARAHSRRQSDAQLRAARSRNSGFYMGIAGGSTIPMGKLKDNVNNSYYMGWNVTVPFGWDFSGFPLGLRFDVAMDNLMGNPGFLDPSGNPTTSRNVAIYSASGGLKLNIPLGRTASRFYLLGGGGAHRITGYATSAAGSDSAQTIQNAKTDVGYYGGAGFNFRFGKTALFLESRYINVNTKQPVGFAYKQATYLPVILGFQF